MSESLAYYLSCACMVIIATTMLYSAQQGWTKGRQQLAILRIGLALYFARVAVSLYGIASGVDVQRWTSNPYVILGSAMTLAMAALNSLDDWRNTPPQRGVFDDDRR